MTWLRALWDGARGLCPACHRGRIFRTITQQNLNCPECGVTFQPYEGDFLGAIAIAYTITATFALIVFLIVNHYFVLTAMQNLAICGTFATIFYLLTYPNTKGLWVAILYLMTHLRKL